MKAWTSCWVCSSTFADCSFLPKLFSAHAQAKDPPQIILCPRSGQGPPSNLLSAHAQAKDPPFERLLICGDSTVFYSWKILVQATRRPCTVG